MFFMYFMYFNGELYDSFSFRRSGDAGPRYGLPARRLRKAGLASTLDKENSCVI